MSSRFAVMGNPIEHSLSPLIHQYFAQQTGISIAYQKILVELGDFPSQVANFFAEGGTGLNVTLPFKQEAYGLALVRTSRCREALAANTLWIKENELHADNTDGVGLLRDLRRHVNLTNSRVLVLGAGGAARGIIAPLLASGIASLTIFNRTVEKAKALKEDFSGIDYVASLSAKDSYDLIINATSAGIHQTSWTWELGCSMPTAFCYDLSYSLQDQTPFVKWAQDQGCFAVDGLGMLVEQAAEAFSIWHGVFPETMPVLAGLRAIEPI